MQIQNQTQLPINEPENLLVSLSEDEQDSIQGGGFFIPLAIAAGRAAAPYIARGAAAAGRGIVNAAKSDTTKKVAKEVGKDARNLGVGVAGAWLYDKIKN